LEFTPFGHMIGDPNELLETATDFGTIAPSSMAWNGCRNRKAVVAGGGIENLADGRPPQRAKVTLGFFVVTERSRSERTA
jgi:hypothetical protein